MDWFSSFCNWNTTNKWTKTSPSISLSVYLSIHLLFVQPSKTNLLLVLVLFKQKRSSLFLCYCLVTNYWKKVYICVITTRCSHCYSCDDKSWHLKCYISPETREKAIKWPKSVFYGLFYGNNTIYGIFPVIMAACWSCSRIKLDFNETDWTSVVCFFKIVYNPGFICYISLM